MPEADPSSPPSSFVAVSRGAPSSHPLVFGESEVDLEKLKRIQEAAIRLRRSEEESSEGGDFDDDKKFLPPGSALLHGRRHW